MYGPQIFVAIAAGEICMCCYGNTVFGSHMFSFRLFPSITRCQGTTQKKTYDI
jgi:hypothetical protein